MGREAASAWLTHQKNPAACGHCPEKRTPGAITASQTPGKNGIRGKRDKDAGKSVTGLTAFSLFRGTAPAKPDASAMCFSAFSIDILQEDSYY